MWGYWGEDLLKVVSLSGRRTLLVGILEGEGGGGAVLPGLGAEVVVEAGAGGHGLGVEVSGEGAILPNTTTKKT